MNAIDENRALTVGEVAKRSGVTVSAIHFYEAKGLIEGWRTAGNQRRYPRGVLRRIAIIRVAQRAGLPLALVKKHLDKIPSTPITAQEWHELSEKWRGLLDERITSLLQLRDQLDSCIGCGCLSLQDCPLRNPQDVLGHNGPGPRVLIEAIAPATPTPRRPGERRPRKQKQVRARERRKGPQ